MAFPTDTVWGVLALMEDEAACKRIYEVKGRPEDKPLQVLVADLESALELVDLGPLEGKFLRLAEAFWPGGSPWWSPGRPSLLGSARTAPWASECRTTPFCGSSSAAWGHAAATSLNKSGEPPVRTEAEARTFAVDFVFPGEAGGLASSVVDLRTGEVLREGAIPKEALLAHLR